MAFGSVSFLVFLGQNIPFSRSSPLPLGCDAYSKQDVNVDADSRKYTVDTLDLTGTQGNLHTAAGCVIFKHV
jgi:hypothetical protein